MLIPFASTYRPIWMALGIVALYLGIAIGISTWIRPRIGYTWWRRLHVLTLGIYILATLHGLGTGSDTQTGWALGIYLVSIALVVPLLCRRLLKSASKRKQRAASAAHLSSLRPLQPASKATQYMTPAGSNLTTPMASPSDTARMLIQAALDGGGSDNVSAIVAHVDQPVL
jgi:hypothetical protein